MPTLLPVGRSAAARKHLARRVQERAQETKIAKEEQLANLPIPKSRALEGARLESTQKRLRRRERCCSTN